MKTALALQSVMQNSVVFIMVPVRATMGNPAGPDKGRKGRERVTPGIPLRMASFQRQHAEGFLQSRTRSFYRSDEQRCGVQSRSSGEQTPLSGSESHQLRKRMN